MEAIAGIKLKAGTPSVEVIITAVWQNTNKKNPVLFLYLCSVIIVCALCFGFII